MVYELYHFLLYDWCKNVTMEPQDFIWHNIKERECSRQGSRSVFIGELILKITGRHTIRVFNDVYHFYKPLGHIIILLSIQ